MKKDVMADKKIEIVNDVQKARGRIERAIVQNGPFSHNIAGLCLHDLASKHGTRYANELIEEMNLTELFDIEPVEE